MKNAYDYLYDHMELLNEAIHNQLNPEHETHEYSYSWEDVKEVQGEVVEENPMNEATFSKNELPKVKDRPTVFAAVLSFVSPFIGIIMFILTRRVTPKSSFLYLSLAIVGFTASYFLMFFFFMRSPMLPKNPILLLSIVNTKLRDFYSNFDELCQDLDESKDEIIDILANAGYIYDKEINQFRER